MKLFFAPGACSLASHIVLRELDLPFELHEVRFPDRRTAAGEDYLAVNPKGYVPALKLEDGEIVTEGAAIVQFLADSRPGAGLAPPAGTLARAQLQSHLNFIAAELHPAFSPLFDPTSSGEAREAAVAKIRRRFGDVERMLSDGRPYLLGEAYSVADAYLFTIVSWAPSKGLDLGDWPKLKAHFERIGARPAVQAALEAEGLTAKAA